MKRFGFVVLLFIAALGYGAPPVEIVPDADPKWKTSLNGDWAFQYHPAVEPLAANEERAQRDFNDSAWPKLKVPSNWELAGYGQLHYAEPVAGTGWYRRSFRLPPDWKQERVFLRIDGAAYGCDVWINGNAIGNWASSYNAVTFDITDSVNRDGENSVAIRVTTRCHGYQFDTNDDWALSGLYRDVTLFALPSTHLVDFDLRTSVGNAGAAQCELLFRASGAGKIAGKLLAPDGKQTATFDVATDGQGAARSAIVVENPLLWTAETPDLYTMEFEFVAANGDRQQVKEHVGLRQISIRDGVLLLNGRPIKLHGADHHDIEPVVGRAMTEEQIRRDLRLMKAANINFIRTSHYPPHPLLPRLCDELGFYLMDEMPAGFGEDKMKDPAYDEDILTRARATVARDHRHPSILVWSIGNENPVEKSLLEAGREVKRLDPTRPICYPAVGSYFDKAFQLYPEFVDIYSPHYPSNARLEHYAKTLTRPVIVTEYAHAFGLATDQVQDQWEIMQASPRLAGGAIWMFQDQGLLRDAKVNPPPADNPYVWTDANHYLDTGGIDGMDGIVYADRRPQVDYWQVRKVYSPVQIHTPAVEAAPGSRGLTLSLENRFDFRSLRGFSLNWEWLRNGHSEQKGNVALTAASRTTEDVAPPIAFPSDPGDAVWAVSLRVVDTDGNALTEWSRPWSANRDAQGVVVGHAANQGEAAQIETVPEGWTVRWSTGQMNVNRATGSIKVYDAAGKSIVDGVSPHAGHRLTQTEIARSKRADIWSDARLEKATIRSVDVKREGDDVRVEIAGRYDRAGEQTGGFDGTITLVVERSGVIAVSYDFGVIAPKLGELPEAGLTLTLPLEASDLSWIGEGPFPGYPGKDRLNEFGIFRTHRGAMNFVGNRRGISVAMASDKSGAGVVLLGKAMDVSVQDEPNSLLLSQNALIAGRGNKNRPPEKQLKTDSIPRVAGQFELLLIDSGKTAPLNDWFSSAFDAGAMEKPYLKSYDQ